MALDIWVVGMGSVVTECLNAVTSMMQSSDWHTLLWIAETIGILTCVLMYLRTHDLKVMFGWGLTYTLVSVLLLVPTVTINVNDLTRPSDVNRVDHVPVGLAVPLYFISGVGMGLSEMYEDYFHFPDERAYTKTGMLFASKLMQDSFTVASVDPLLTRNMVEYTKNCVIPDIILNHKYSFKDMMTSTDVQSVIFSNPSPLRGIYWRSDTGSTFMYCRDAMPQLKSLLQTQSSSSGDTFLTHAARMLPGNTSAQTVYADQLAGSYNYFFDSSKTAQTILLQNIAVAGLRRGLNSYLKSYNNEAAMRDIASESALMKLRLGNQVSYIIATESMPELYIVLLVFGIGIFPIVSLLLFIREMTWPAIRSYLSFMGSLILWPPLFAVFNFIVNFTTQGSFEFDGPTVGNLDSLMSTSSSAAGFAGWMMLSIPFLAFKLFTGLGQGFASVGSSVGSLLSSNATSEAGPTAAGNHSVGNVQVDNINGFKTNLNREYREGSDTVQLPNGALQTRTSDGQTVFDASPAISRLPVDLHLDRNLASAAQRMTRDSMNQTEMAQTGYNHSVQENAIRMRQFHEQYGSSDSQSLSSATGLTVTEAERVNRMKHVAEDYANRNHISLTQSYSELQDKARSLQLSEGVRGQVGVDTSKSLVGKVGSWATGLSAKGDVHAGLEGTERTGSTSQTSDEGRSGQDNSHTLSARESQDFSQGMDTLRSYSVTHNGQHTDNNASGMLTQISSGITTSDSRYQQYTTSQSHTHELQAMASETETLSAGAKENYTQQFVKWVQQKAPEDAQTLLTDAGDAEVSARRDGLVQDFMAEKLRGGVDAHYTQSAAGTGAGMSAPANGVAPESGAARAGADAEIDGRVAGNHLRTDVEKEVAAMPGVVKNEAEHVKGELEKSNHMTQSGMDAREKDLENAEGEYIANRNGADKQQSKILSNPLVSKTHKDYMNEEDN